VYLAVASIARHPVLFKELAVPDTLDGRFDAVVLHLALLMRQLESFGGEGHMLARQVAGAFVDDMDQTVREMGVGDLSVGKQVKRMARALYGRLDAYNKALMAQPDGRPLEEALGRNLYAGREPAAGVLARTAKYVDGLNRRIEEKSLDDFLRPAFSEALVQAAAQAAREAGS
jgi:cytochrome b pre-mRNA-processing protein 3